MMVVIQTVQSLMADQTQEKTSEHFADLLIPGRMTTTQAVKMWMSVQMLMAAQIQEKTSEHFADLLIPGRMVTMTMMQAVQTLSVRSPMSVQIQEETS